MTTHNPWILHTDEVMIETMRMLRTESGDERLEEVVEAFKKYYGENPDEEARVRRLWKEAQS